MKRALITGITGQDGSYLCELLLSKGYEVHGLMRRISQPNTARLDAVQNHPQLHLHHGDLSDAGPITELVYNLKPEEIYHLGAQSHVQVSFDTPEYTGDITALGTTRLLEAIRRSGIQTRFYQASSSEMFGSIAAPQNEGTPFHPRSPYAAAKAYAYWMAINYRESYKLFIANGILFNHESPRRGEAFVSRKITKAVAHILAGKQKKVFLGNLKARRDWGFAPEYAECQWRILQEECPDDFVIGTGESHTVEEFVTHAFEYAQLDWREHVAIDPQYFRPSEADDLRADASKARARLQWSPKVSFHELVKIMVDADVRALGLAPRGEGERALSKKDIPWLHR